mmetsp:Transcript_24864/g.81833  ORF Transcript_24864/g.81833 Transcript_24864/m.81833 type:complete len:228 (+) Transcript_24864:1617-2300(+)
MASLAEVKIIAFVAAEATSCDRGEPAAVACDHLDLYLQRSSAFHPCSSLHLAPLGRDCTSLIHVRESELSGHVELGLRLVGQLELQVPVPLPLLLVLDLRTLLPVRGEPALENNSPASFATGKTQDITFHQALLGRFSFLPIPRVVTLNLLGDTRSACLKGVRYRRERLIPRREFLQVEERIRLLVKMRYRLERLQKRGKEETAEGQHVIRSERRWQAIYSLLRFCL